MKRFIAVLAVVVTSSNLFAADAVVPPAPMRVTSGAKLYVPQDEFGLALSAAILKRHVPVSVVTDESKATFVLTHTSKEKRAGQAEKVTRILAFGAFGGSGDSFDATVSIVNADGAVVFAHNSRKGNFQSAAQNVAKELGKQIAN